MPRFKCEYTYSRPFGSGRHRWTCIGRKGAMDFHVSGPFDPSIRAENEGYSGGLETHFREPPDYMAEDAPSHEKCHTIGGPCWHDGTSLYASERLIPFWLHDKNDHERIFEMLKREYADRFPEPEAAKLLTFEGAA